MAVAMESGRFESGESERRMEKFDLEGVNSVDLKDGRYLIVLRGLLGKARTFISDRPAELLFGDDKTRESRGLLKRLKGVSNSFAGKVLQATGVGCAAMAGACGGIADADNGSDHGASGISGQFGVDESALTGDDASHFGTPQPVPWSEWKDANPLITEYEGKKVIVFNRNVTKPDGSKYGGIFYVECDELEKCITEGASQEVQGLQENYPAFWNSKFPDNPFPSDMPVTFGSGIIFKDEKGGYKLLSDGDGSLEFFADLTKNSDDVLEASNFESTPFVLEGIGPVPVNGVPHLITNDHLTNLHTFETQEVGYSTYGDCGDTTPHWSEDGSWIVAMKGKYVQNEAVCEFVSAESLDALINNIGVKYLKNVNDYNKTALGTWGGRIGQNVFIYLAEGPKGTKLYYALIQPYCGDGKADEGETFANCPQDVLPPQDAVTFTDVPDAGSTEQETGVGPDVVAGPDTIQIDSVSIDTAKEVDGAVGVDAQGADAQPDTQTDTALPPDTKPDTQSNTDTLVSLCDDVEFEGNCDMSCDEPNATFTGKCTATVNIGGKFVEFEIDGEYTFNLLEEAGNLLKGGVEVDDKGVGVPTSYGPYDFVPTGTVYRPEGIVEGNFEMCKVLLKEGQITVYYNGEEIAVLNVGDEVTFANGEPITPVQPDVGEDASQADSGQTDASEGTDADKPDLGGGKDAGGSVDTPNNPGEDTVAQVEPKKGGGGGGGCSVSPAETSEIPKRGHAILFLAGIALGLIYRRFPHIKGL